MKRFLRKHVFPFVAAALLLPTIGGGAAKHRSARLELGLAAEVNTFRAAHGLPPLQTSPQLQAAAQAHSFELAEKGYFSHASGDGGSFWERVRRFYPVGGAQFWSVGENLYWSSEGHSASFVINRWSTSPEHRRVLERKKWREMGVSAIWVQNAPGVYGGRDVAIVTVDFGVRR
jgi:uncharacterized protein YkwD